MRAAGAGMMTRPTLDEVRAYRAHVDAALLAALPDLPEAARELVALGCHHEQQHQELLLTDILHLFSRKPARARALARRARKVPVAMPGPIGWIEGAGGIVEIGHDGDGVRLRLRRAAPPRAARPRTRSPTAPSPTANGPRSSPTAAIATRAVARRRLGLGEGGGHRSAALLGGARRRAGPASASTAAARSIPPRRSRMSASTRPTPMPAGPARACRPSSNGKPPPPATTRRAATSSTPPARSSRARRPTARPFSATSGNGPAAPIAPIPASARRRARSANITASS